MTTTLQISTFCIQYLRARGIVAYIHISADAVRLESRPGAVIFTIIGYTAAAAAAAVLVCCMIGMPDYSQAEFNLSSHLDNRAIHFWR